MYHTIYESSFVIVIAFLFFQKGSKLAKVPEDNSDLFAEKSFGKDRKIKGINPKSFAAGFAHFKIGKLPFMYSFLI